MAVLEIVDILSRIALLVLSVMVWVEFRSIYSTSSSTDLLRGIILVVGTTSISVAYYIIASLLEPELYRAMLMWGFTVQIPRVWAMIVLLKAMRRG